MTTKKKTLADLKTGDMVTCAPLMPMLSSEPVYAVVEKEGTGPTIVHLYWHDVYLGTEPLGPPKAAKKKRVIKKNSVKKNSKEAAQ